MNRNNFAVKDSQGLFIQPIRPSLSPEFIIKTPCYSITDQGIRQSGIYIGIYTFKIQFNIMLVFKSDRSILEKVQLEFPPSPLNATSE